MWDVCIARIKELELDVRELAKLEAQISRTSDTSEKRHLSKQRDKKLGNLRESWEREAKNDPTRVLVGPIVDNASVWWFEGFVNEEFVNKENVRVGIYMGIAQKLRINGPGKICDDLDFRPNFEQLLSLDGLGLQADFEFLTPWYSKDDRVFYVMDNPVRKDRVFGVPFMAASSWKGMLRWACRMQAGLREHLAKNRGRLDGWRDPDWIRHLFGNEKGEEQDFHRGALVFYPTWFDRIGFEVINPHSRARRAGTQPIYYEVVPGRRPRQDNPNEYEESGKGTLCLLYAPWPGMKPEAKPKEVLSKLLEAIETLLTTYGISAKRTVGWGTAKVLKWRAFHKTHGKTEKDGRHELEQEIRNWLTAGGAP